MSSPAPALVLPASRFGLLHRLGVVAGILVVELLITSYGVQGTPIESVSGTAHLIRETQHWGFRFLIAYCVSLTILAYLRGPGLLAAIAELAVAVPVRLRWAVAHGVSFGLFIWLTFTLYQGSSFVPSVALLWHGLALGTALTLCAALAPLTAWRGALRLTGALPLYAVVPAAGALAVFQASQLLWRPTAVLTFRLVALMLTPLCPSLQADPTSLTLITDNFEVTVSEVCSGLEGMGLMAIFCTTWLWVFRREYHFPRALVIVPSALLLIFLLNSVRIAALVLIGTAGYPRIATTGFHSQAGWIAFNLAALGVAIVAKRSPWLNRHAAAAGTPAAGTSAADDAVAAYLMPLLGILGCGMIAHALSAGFDLLYPLRLIAAAALLWHYRACYRSLDWRFSWRGVLTGAAIFVVWMAFVRWLSAPAAEPAALAELPAWQRVAWVACRAASAVITVPIAEELAYRGFLLRRLVRADFTGVAFAEVGGPALAAGAVLFGVTHGTLWLPGVLAGVAYGLLAIRTGRLGESVVAHATTNAMLAASVLLFDQWQLW